jgi:hypothetical protein
LSTYYMLIGLSRIGVTEMSTSCLDGFCLQDY